MRVKSIKTRVFLPPKDDLFSLIKESVDNLEEKSIIVFTSKIVSIWQGRCKKIASIKSKDELIKKEADLYLERKNLPEGSSILTIKDNTLIPTAGIDESNAKGHYILWPEKPFLAAEKIYKFIKKNYRLKKFGVIISDSHCIPLRAGTVGISVSYFGFDPLKDYRGEKDIFGREMKISQLNIADSLAAAATLAMGEGKEQTPIAVIEDIAFVDFKESAPQKINYLKIERKEDIYAPLLEAVKWKSQKISD